MTRQKPARPTLTSITLPGLVDPHDLSTDRQFAMNLARGLQVLRAFTATDPLLGNGEISERTGLHKATVSRLTYTLTLLGYLCRDISMQKYQLGAGVLSLAHPMLAGMQIRQIARPLMEKLALETKCNVNLGMRDRANVVYIDSVRADINNRYLPDIGSTRPLMAGAIGRALVMACPPDQRAAILNFLKLQDKALFARHEAEWLADQKQFEKRGFFYGSKSWAKDIQAVAAPVRMPLGGLPMAMNCTLSTNLASEQTMVRDVAPRLLDVVRQIEASQGTA